MVCVNGDDTGTGDVMVSVNSIDDSSGYVAFALKAGSGEAISCSMCSL
jgi:hypothetical protein